jgi:catechol 2,3-dioxygenase-like lactoylglutathione lyase family enzyme
MTMPKPVLDPASAVVPELDVGNLSVSLDFYVELLGFRVVFDRPDERFVYLSREKAELMLQEAAGPGRRFRTAPLEQPFGRGVNFQLKVSDVDTIYARLVAAGHEPIIAMEERWYRVDVSIATGRFSEQGVTEVGNRQFVVADPDGYLWRPFCDLGTRPIPNGGA